MSAFFRHCNIVPTGVWPWPCAQGLDLGGFGLGLGPTGSGLGLGLDLVVMAFINISISQTYVNDVSTIYHAKPDQWLDDFKPSEMNTTNIDFI